MKLFPFGGNTALLAEQYNREVQLEAETIRDFIILHYHLTQRDDSPYWDHYRTMKIPDSLAHRMAIFKENGYVWLDDVGLFRVDSWVQVMMGQALTPEQHHQGSQAPHQRPRWPQPPNSGVFVGPRYYAGDGRRGRARAPR